MNWWADPAPTLREIDSLIGHAFRSAAEHMTTVVSRAPSDDGDAANGIIVIRNEAHDIIGFAVLIPAPTNPTVFILEAHMLRELAVSNLFNFAFMAIEGIGVILEQSNRKISDLFISTANPEGLAVATALGALKVAHEKLSRIPGIWLKQTISVAASAYQKAKAADIH